jgi:hypothetical protein
MTGVLDGTFFNVAKWRRNCVVDLNAVWSDSHDSAGV